MLRPGKLLSPEKVIYEKGDGQQLSNFEVQVMSDVVITYNTGHTYEEGDKFIRQLPKNSQGLPRDLL